MGLGAAAGLFSCFGSSAYRETTKSCFVEEFARALSVNPCEPAAPRPVLCTCIFHGSPRAAAAVMASGVAVKVGPCLQGSVLFMETFEGLEGKHSPCSRNVHGIKEWC